MSAFVDNNIKLPFVRGLMAFYPLVSSVDRLASLDGWLLSVLQRAIRERNRLIRAAGLTEYSISRASLLSGDWYQSDIPNESRVPSFVRGWRAARKFYKRYGLSEVKAPSYYALLSHY